MDKMQNRHIVVRVTLNLDIYPTSPAINGNPPNVKIIRANSDNDTLTADIRINKVSGFVGSDCTATIYGMLIDDINAMLKINSYEADLQTPISDIEIFAGYEVDVNGYPPLVYKGAIWESNPDFNAENRSRPLIIKSYNGWEQSGNLSPAYIVKNKIPLKTLFEELAAKFTGCSTVISGTDGQFAESVIFEGSSWQQIQQACANYGYAFKLDDNVIKIAPIGQPMVKQVLTISPDDNLLGYPTSAGFTATIRTRFNPAIQFGMLINLDTSVEAYQGGWFINGLSHHLTNRDRDWTTTMQLNRYSSKEGA